MKEARGNMLEIDCDAVVVTTNGFVKSNGACVMGRGIAKQVADVMPQLPQDLGHAIKTYGNRVHVFNYIGCNETIVTFPVKPVSVVNDGTNIVSHGNYRINQTVPGFHAKAQIEIIEQSLKELVSLTTTMGWADVICPRFGCGAGELDWESQIKPLAAKYLDDRFTIYTF